MESKENEIPELNSNPLPGGGVIAPHASTTHLLRGILHFGASSIGLLIAEVQEDGKLKELDYFERPVSLARDIFRLGMVSRGTIEHCASVVRGFKNLLRTDYLIERPSAWATNILAEAANHEIFLNRMQVAAGVSVEMIDDGEMSRLIYLVALRFLKKNPQIAKTNTLFWHVGPGNTRALYFTKGRISSYKSYRLGIYRAKEALIGSEDIEANLDLLEENIHGLVDQFHEHYENITIDNFVAIGTEIQFIAKFLADKPDFDYQLTVSQLDKLVEEVTKMDETAVLRRFQAGYSLSEVILPALQTNLSVAQSLGDDLTFHVPYGDFYRDILIDLAEGAGGVKGLQQEVLDSAEEIMRKYKCDRKHAHHVADLCQKLFKELQHLHQLGSRHELLLRTAAILHEVGNFISPREHHKHSLYIILNSDIFGLNSADKLLVALLARYHRRYAPDKSHPYFSDLDRDERILLFKLASILRVADALDRAHSQRIRNIMLDTRGDVLYIHTPDISDATIEQIAINQKGDLFREIYGYEVIISPAL